MAAVVTVKDPEGFPLFRVVSTEVGCGWCGEDKRAFHYFTDRVAAARAAADPEYAALALSAFCTIHCFDQARRNGTA